MEQLRTHQRRLNSLHPPEQHGGRPVVQLYEKGYGKDAAGIAMEAIAYGKKVVKEASKNLRISEIFIPKFLLLRYFVKSLFFFFFQPAIRALMWFWWTPLGVCRTMPP